MSLVVSAVATIWPVSAPTTRCSLRHDRRVRVPCFSSSHSPGPHSLSPVLSTNRCTGSASPPASGLGRRGCGTSTVTQLGHLRRGVHGGSTDFPGVLADF